MKHEHYFQYCEGGDYGPDESVGEEDYALHKKTQKIKPPKKIPHRNSRGFSFLKNICCKF